jgi:hypothetical protein
MILVVEPAMHGTGQRAINAGIISSLRAVLMPSAVVARFRAWLSADSPAPASSRAAINALAT